MKRRVTIVVSSMLAATVAAQSIPRSGRHDAATAAWPADLAHLPQLKDAVVESSSSRPGGAATWVGRVSADPSSLIVITRVANAYCGSIWRREGAFGITRGPVGAGGEATWVAIPRESWDVVSCRGNAISGKVPRFGAPASAVGSVPLPDRTPEPRGVCACPESAGRIDVLCVYTPAAAAGAGDAASLQARVQNGLDTTTAVIASSGAGATVMNLVGFVEIAYDESAPTWDDHLIRLADPSDGFLDEVHALRDQYNADLVTLVIDDVRFTGGRAYYATFWPESAFSVNNWRAAGAGSLTLAHEFGHNFGCAHDRENADAGVFFFGFGHHFNFGGDELGSVMSYVGETVPYYSTPRLHYMNGPLLGVPLNEPLPSANALVVERARWALANFRDGEAIADCNGNGIDDALDIAEGTSVDLNGDCRPDECETRLYVDVDAGQGGDGLTWTGALNDLTTALDLARIPCSNVTEIWVADGTYVPGRGSNDRAARFSLRSGLRLYGGFQGQSHPSGGETSVSQRNPLIYATILSGEIGDPLALFDNCSCVVEAIDVDAFGVLDGFTIERGYSGFDGAGLLCLRSDPTIRNCAFRDLFAAGAGAAVFLGEGSSPVIDTCRFENNAVYGVGGAVAALDGSSPSLTTCVFVSNTAAWAGALSVGNGSAPVLTGCTFASNSAVQSSGAVDIYDESAVSFTNCAFLGNSAGDWAGGASVSGASSATFAQCQFIGNAAANVGGGLTGYEGELILTDCEFRFNQADYGGGLVVSTLADADVSRTAFSDNMVSLGGGACDVWAASLRLTDCTFLSNDTSAGDGGACRVNAGSAVAIQRTSFHDNVASDGGGAIRVWDSEVRVLDSTFSRNYAVQYGGAIAVASGGEFETLLAIDGATFRLNHATSGSSGAIDLWASDAAIVNTVFLSNDAGDSGGALGVFSASTLTAANCTLYANVAANLGGGVVSYDSDAFLSNCILWANASSQPDAEAAQLRFFGGSSTLDYNAVQGWTGVLGGAANFGSNPGFVDAAAGNLRLAAGSPCIDSGSVILTPVDSLDRDSDTDFAEALPWDRDGEPRFVDVAGAANVGALDPSRPYLGPVDRGAFETPASVCPGDVDADGDVDLTDLATLLGHFGRPSGATLADGDLDGDGDVDLTDLAALLANFGSAC